jgi:hypothetical protein
MIHASRRVHLWNYLQAGQSTVSAKSSVSSMIISIVKPVGGTNHEVSRPTPRVPWRLTSQSVLSWAAWSPELDPAVRLALT